MRTLVALSLLLTSTMAWAQDGSERRQARDYEGDIVREIERGFYVKTNIGTTLFFNTHNQTRATGASLFSGVVGVGLGVGYDIVDRERLSVSVEGQFAQGLFNGPRTQDIPFQNLSQGDIHTLSGVVLAEVSGYLTRRFGIGVHGGAGAMFVPVLVEPNAYVNELQRDIGGPAQLHSSTLISLIAGPTFEYYTKLAHFSIGADVDVVFIPGFDLGVAPSGYLKYTF